MRFVLVAVLWAVIVGGLSWYTARPAASAASYGPPAAVLAAGAWSLDVTTTFAIAPDPFALDVGDAAPAGLVVRLNGAEVLRRSEEVAAGAAVTVSPLPGLRAAGPNAFHLEAAPPVEALGQAHAVRVRLQRDGVTVAERSFWSEPNGPLAASFTIDLSHTHEAGDAAGGHGNG
jgi:hypothetical protein